MARDHLTITLETLTDFAAQHQANLLKIDATLGELVASQDKLVGSIDKLTERIDNLARLTDSNQVIVSSLIALAATQQETVNRLLARTS